MHRHEQGVHGAAPSHAARPSISISLFCFHYSQVCSLLYKTVFVKCHSYAVLLQCSLSNEDILFLMFKFDHLKIM